MTPALRAWTRQLSLLVTLAVASAVSAQAAEPAPSAAPSGDPLWDQAVDLTDNEKFGDALRLFKEFLQTRDDATVYFNIAYCERALGDYVAARETLAKVLANPEGLDGESLIRARGYMNEIEQMVWHVTLSMRPPPKQLEIDGRPLRESRAEPGTWILGDSTSKPPTWTEEPRVIVLLPGVHIFRATRDGHAPAIVRKVFGSDESDRHVSLPLELNLLPATLMVRSQPSGAVVRVNESDAGLTPLKLIRPAGRYRIDVFREGYERQTSTIELRPGQEHTLPATLPRYHAPLRRKWWFWTTLAAGLGGAVAATYAIVKANQPGPEPPPYDGGSTDWVVETSERGSAAKADP